MGIDLDIHPDQLVGLIRRSERLQLVSRAGYRCDDIRPVGDVTMGGA